PASPAEPPPLLGEHVSHRDVSRTPTPAGTAPAPARGGLAGLVAGDMAEPLHQREPVKQRLPRYAELHRKRRERERPRADPLKDALHHAAPSPRTNLLHHARNLRLL